MLRRVPVLRALVLRRVVVRPVVLLRAVDAVLRAVDAVLRAVVPALFWVWAVAEPPVLAV